MELLITSHNAGSSDAKPSEDACAGVRLAEGALGIVCDGVGSARGGGEAASRVVRHFTEAVPLRPRLWTPDQVLNDLASQMNAMLHEEAVARYGQPELICTLAAVLVSGNRLHGINSGDTLVFLYRDGGIQELSTRHSGDNDESHVLTQALGLSREYAGTSFTTELVAGDLVLLCSDGLTDGLDPARLAELLARKAVARGLVTTAREKVVERGDEPDDISAVVIEVVNTTAERESAVDLYVPGEVRAGDRIVGCVLESPLIENGRVWKVALDTGGAAVLKLAPLEARDDEHTKAAFEREIWHALRVRSDLMPSAWLPDAKQVPGYFLEYMAAPTLDEVLRAGPLAIEETVALAKFLVAVGQALAELDLLHGDIKPENIMVLGRAEKAAFKLIDFGSMARPFALVKRAGTATFLAPERFAGSGISECTEIYAIGVVLYRALTGKYPFGEIERFQVPRFDDNAKGPSRFNRVVPLWLDAVVQRCLAIDPEQRYAHFSEARFELDNPEKVAPFRRPNAPLLERNPLRFYKVVCVILVAVVVVQAWWIAKR